MWRSEVCLKYICFIHIPSENNVQNKMHFKTNVIVLQSVEYLISVVKCCLEAITLCNELLVVEHSRDKPDWPVVACLTLRFHPLNISVNWQFTPHHPNWCVLSTSRTMHVMIKLIIKSLTSKYGKDNRWTLHVARQFVTYIGGTSNIIKDY